MPILAFFVVLAIVLALVFIILLAVNPVGTLLITVRIVSFFVAALTAIIFFVTFSSSGGPEWSLLMFAVPAALVWVGTFALER